MVPTADGLDLDYEDGTVHEVRVSTGGEPAVLTVATGDDETIRIGTDRLEGARSAE